MKKVDFDVLNIYALRMAKRDIIIENKNALIKIGGSGSLSAGYAPMVTLFVLVA